MNMTIPLSIEHINCKAVADLIDSYSCSFEYVPQDELFYAYFSNKTDYYNFIERLQNIIEKTELLEYCFELEV